MKEDREHRTVVAFHIRVDWVVGPKVGEVGGDQVYGRDLGLFPLPTCDLPVF